MYADHVRFDPSHLYIHRASTDALIHKHMYEKTPFLY